MPHAIPIPAVSSAFGTQYRYGCILSRDQIPLCALLLLAEAARGSVAKSRSKEVFATYRVKFLWRFVPLQPAVKRTVLPGILA
jgi:hypothetical protein